MAGRSTKKPTPKRRPAQPAHRPSKYAPGLVGKLCGAIACGSTIEEACRRVGITHATYFEWRRAKPDFFEKVEAAKDVRLETLEERWVKASEKDWRAAQALLAVLKPKKFAQRISVHVETELSAAMARLKEAFKDDPEQLERALATLAGEPGEARAPEAPAGPDDGHAGSGEAVHPPRTV